MENQIDNLIQILGWGYFLTWSFSFYGQLLLNYELKSVEGMNLDYLHLNISGYIFYTIYCLYGYIYHNSAETGKVNVHDLLFSVHALFICLLTLIQTFIYPRGNNAMSTLTKQFLRSLWIFCFGYWFLMEVIKVHIIPPKLRLISFLGYFKLLITFLKYWPQMIWNFKRKSTKGFSICGVIMDFSGGILSLLQLYLEYKFWQNANINPVKLILSLITIGYNIMFIIQRYWLYPYSSVAETRQQQLYINCNDNLCSKRRISYKSPLPIG